MTPIADSDANATPLPPSAPTAPLDADLDSLISLSNANDNQTIAVVDDQGTRVGVVTTAILLRAVQGAEN